ncbi:anion exchange protein 4 isoform X11 [Octodon degus]|uniref:Anion exchange protein 4 isoform X11 n=1 Tax=Octodon degus TaxID=10160 RepID=A0A6P6DGI0_OCTDE|nr:anion exchange protein 4 isoform X11 [Octodon degus]
MKLQGQEEYEASSAHENVSAGELESDHGPSHSPGSSSETDSRELGVCTDPPLFIQLNELLGWPEALEWRETGRWMLFEEKLEVDAGRWSAPHVPTLALPSLQHLRSLLVKGLVLLDCPARNLLELVEQVIRVESLSPELRGQLQALLLQRPQHHIQTRTWPCWGSTPPKKVPHNENVPLKEQHQNPLRQKLPPEAEVATVLAGELGFLPQPLGAFVRLRDPVVLGTLTEVPLPSRFFCLLLGPAMPGRGYHEMGRAAAVLLSDPQFQWSVRRASNLHDLLAALDAFLEEVTVLPPGRWDPTARILPPKCLSSQHKRSLSRKREVEGFSTRRMAGAEDRRGPGPQVPCPELQRTGRECWKVSWELRWLELPSACWQASRSPSSAALGQCWSLSACFSLSAGNESQWATTKQKNRDDILSMVRKVLSDFSSVLAILLGCGLDAFLGLATPKLTVPTEFKPTLPGRGWLVSPFGANPWWLSVAAALPALLLTILIFMDQQITAVILNRAEYKLQKGAGFHLDLFCVAVLILLTSALGLPWYVSATVISLAHMDSLRRESRVCAPGEAPSFLGIREQRLTGLVVFILTGFSIFLAPVLKFIPMPVLYGIFLYMGVAALSSIQFVKRVQLLLMPAKHQPDLMLLRHVPLNRVHLFTAIQLVCLGLLWIIKSTPAAIIFPLMLLGLVGVRKALEWFFSPQELLWLDELMPEEERSISEKGLEPEQSFGGDESQDSELMYQPKVPEINISVN